jgi:hypothetical protein
MKNRPSGEILRFWGSDTKRRGRIPKSAIWNRHSSGIFGKAQKSI